MSELAHDPHRWYGLTVLDPSGETVGRVAEVYLDAADDRPAWLVLGGRPFGIRKFWAPVLGVWQVDDELHTPFSAQQIRQAPRPSADGIPAPEQAMALYHHYGISATVEPGPDPGRHVAGPGEPGSTDDAMTRSEEEVLLRRTVRPAERVRLVKHVVVEERQLTVRVRREVLRLERIPYGPGQGAGEERMGELGDLEEIAGEIVLYEEHPVVGTRVVPRERVRLVKSTVTEDRMVRTDVAKEQIDVEEGPLR